MAESSSAEGEKVSAEAIRIEMRGKVRGLAWPSEPGESVKGCIRRVSRATGLSFGQVKALWYSEWRRVPADIADRIREASNAHERRIEQQMQAVKANYERAYALVHHGTDPEFHGAHLPFDGGPAHPLGGKTEGEAE